MSITLGKLRRYKWLYLLMVPGALYYFIFHYIPMAGLMIAFQKYNLMKGISGSPWVGLDNFKVIFSTPEFPVLIKNTLIISVYKIIFGMLPDILLALALNEVGSKHFRKIIQTVTYAPYFLSWIIVFGLTFAFLSSDGLLNMIITAFGGEKSNLLADKDAFRPILIITDIWKNTGFGAIIYLAALTSIDPTLYEAATVDGAGRWRQMWHITLPGIRDVFILLLILRIGHILDAGFEQVYIYLNDLVLPVGDILDTWVFRRGLEEMEFSIAAATGFFKAVIGFILVIGANRLAKKVTGSSIW